MQVSAGIRAFHDPILARARGEGREKSNGGEPTAEHRRLPRLSIQLVGVTDIPLGVARGEEGSGMVVRTKR